MLRGVCRGLTEEFGKRGNDSDYGHSCVSTCAGITTITVCPKKMMIMILCYGSHLVQAVINVGLC